MKKFSDYLEEVRDRELLYCLNEGKISDFFLDKLHNLLQNNPNTFKYSLQALILLALAFGYNGITNNKAENILKLPEKQRIAEIQKMRDFVEKNEGKFLTKHERGKKQHYNALLNRIDSQLKKQLEKEAQDF